MTCAIKRSGAYSKDFFLTTFDELGLAEPILRAVRNEGYETPTPIQAHTIPFMSEGHDIVGIAQTGTGKTAAFVLPLLNRLSSGMPRPASKTCHALILAPTRELASQILDQIRVYGRFMRISTAVIVGGMKYPPQIKAMARGVDIIVATPGRLIDHMQEGNIQLAGTSVVVLDEADQMLDLGFLPPIKRILGACSPKRQTVLYSATMPKAIRGLADEFLKDPKEVSVAAQSRPIDAIAQSVRHVRAAEKPDALIALIKEQNIDRGIVFTRTKYGADKLTKKLNQAGLDAEAIHGNKTQGQRQRALNAFKHGSVKLLIATDIAARGIDVDDVSHVINFELPNVPESYVHRIGRTARAGNTGIAVSFCDGEERGYLRDIERLINATIKVEGPEPPPMRSNRPGNKPKPSNRRPAANRNRAANGNSGRPAGKRDGARRAAS